jgi:hypothetical protein
MPCLRTLRSALGLMLCLSAISCGGGGGGGSGSVAPTPPAPTTNVADVIVDQGPTSNSVNSLFVSVTLCLPGSTNCQTIDHIQVDTGSYGLRILAPVLTLTLPLQTLAGGQTLAECTIFVDGYSWGPVELADVQIAGETASSLPIQAIGDSRFTNVPADCSGMAMTEEDTVATFGANGILGIGPFASDCPNCVNTVIPGTYYACSGTSCVGTMVPLSSQVPNPVTRFATDNNGTIIQLPTVADAGQLTVTGTLTFGVDTQSNNQSGTETVLTVDENAELTMTYKGQPLSQSFIDSGSNGIYFNDSSITVCTAMNLTDFYCPANTLDNLVLSIQGLNGVLASANFSIGNAQTMFTNNPTFNAFPLLGGTNPNAASFDYGLTFFYGRRVATVVEGSKTSVGTGPYIAF